PGGCPVNLIKYKILADQLRTEANSFLLMRGQMAVQPLVHHAKNPDQAKRQDDEIEGHDRIGNEGVEGLISEVIRVIKRVAALLKRREPREKDQCRRMEQKDRLIGI